MKPNRATVVASWIAQLIAASILAQTLFFKFTGAEEPRYIFSTLGVEPWGRIASGIAELVAVVLLLVPRTATAGALLSVAIMAGAIASHLGKLGVVVQDDGGLLFGLAVTVLLAGVGILFLRRRELGALVQTFLPAPGMPCSGKSCGH